MLHPDFDDVLSKAKQRFLRRHLEQCGYLRVDIAHETNAVVLAMRFTLDRDRLWHQASATIGLAALRQEDVVLPVEAAFAELDDGIETARLAHVFRPMSAAERLDHPRFA
jgi:hypothetical protein